MRTYRYACIIGIRDSEGGGHVQLRFARQFKSMRKNTPKLKSKNLNSIVLFVSRKIQRSQESYMYGTMADDQQNNRRLTAEQKREQSSITSSHQPFAQSTR